MEETERPSNPEHARQIAYMATQWLSGRRFFISSTGKMGLAPYRAEIGDLICVLFGSCNPVILRPEEGYYAVVGDAYVYGLMHGEAMEDLSDGKYNVEEFVLH